jgi:hypothetical protein
MIVISQESDNLKMNNDHKTIVHSLVKNGFKRIEFGIFEFALIVLMNL